MVDPLHDDKFLGGAPFSCDVSFVEARAVVVVRGEIDLATAPIILAQVRDTIAIPPGGLALDFDDVVFMDSSGADALLTMRDEAAAQDVPFTLAAVAETPRLVLDVLGLSSLFGLQRAPKGVR